MTFDAISRRTFLHAAVLAAGGVALPAFLRSATPPQETAPTPSLDDIALTERLRSGGEEEFSRLPVGERVAAMGRTFLGWPYTASSLEEAGEEHLVVNLRAFDCVTFCETTLALARVTGSSGATPADFRGDLQLIRYRSGLIAGYPSRLHYFTEWVSDNNAKKVVADVTRSIGGAQNRKRLNFMSTHRSAYAQLSQEEVYARIVETEKRLSRMERYRIERERVAPLLPKIMTGDIIGITTSVNGLDCAHTGIAVREGEMMRLLHAPRAGERVQFTKGSLADYIAGDAQHTGIIVARPLERTRA